MRQRLLDLYEIQQIDLNIREIEKRKESLPARLQELDASTATVRAEIATIEEQRAVIIKELKTLEGTVKAEAVKIRKWEQRLQEIRNQREYLALSREVEGGKRANREAEEKILELMANRDQLDKRFELLQDQLAEQEVDLAAERDTVGSQVAEIDSAIQVETARRDALVPKVPKPLWKKYETIRAKRLGVGLVPVIDGCCQGCNMRLPPQLFNILQRADTIEQCPSCQRIIFWGDLLPKGDGAPAVDHSAKKGVEASP